MIELIRKLQNEISNYIDLEQEKGFFEIDDIQRIVDEYLYLMFQFEKISKIIEQVKKITGNIE